MADVGSIWLYLGLNTDNLVQGLDKAKMSLNTWRDETNRSSSDMLRWGAAITVTIAPLMAAGYAVMEFAQKAAAMGKVIKDNARDLGLSTEQYQKWTHAAVAAGSSAEEITGSIRMLTIRLKEVKDPESEAARYLSAMGISAIDSNGKLRDTDAVLRDILPALNALPEGMDRNQASMVLFGRGFSNIADLTSLSRKELEALLAVPAPFSDAELETMDEYNTKLALINEKWGIMSADIGLELIPLMEDVLTLVEDVRWATSPMMVWIDDAVFGVHTLTTGLKLLWLEGRRGAGEFGGGPEAQAEYDRIWQEYIDAGYAKENPANVKKSPMDYRMERLIQEQGDSLKVADKKGEAKSDPNAMTPFEIIKMQTNLDTLTKVTLVDQKNDLKILTDKYTAMGDHGSEAAKKISREIIKLNNDIKAGNNLVAEMTDKLTKAGAPTTSGGPTYNTAFKGALQAGGVGPDWAGYSDLANMSMSELEAMAKGGLGKSKGMADKAQQYLTLMKANGGGSTSTGTSKKTDPVTAEKEIGTAATDATNKVTDAYKDRLDSVKTYGDDLLGLYMVQEQQDLTHWTATTEMMRISLQNMSDSWKQYVTFAAKFPTIHNIGVVTWTKSGPDWDPLKNQIFMQSSRMSTLASQNLAYAKADFGSVALSKPTETKNEVKVAVVVNVDKNGKATATAESTTTKVQQAGIGG